ncbi:MAG: hypothetical protein QOC82_820 [Frankiaceae bacterium]|jgi:uncharacterized protein (DUF1697 family)|nr:hypothetical protein [Frankiaceae bacterium]
MRAMTTHVALLRAVNLGPTNRIAMADLRALLEGLGYGDVRTLQVAGNAVFTAPARSAATVERAVEKALANDLRLPVKVLARSASDLGKVVAGNPFTGDKGLHAVFLSGQPKADLDPAEYAPAEFAFGDRVVYLRLPHGIAGSRLPSWEKVLGVTATARNWNTVTKLHALAKG